MKTIMQHLKTFTLAVSLTLCVSMPVLAEDIEVYTGGSNQPSTVRPNLVFIFDTSGSMDGNVTTTSTNGDYDYTIDYSASPYNGNCNNNRTYWSSNGSVPSCNTNRYINNAYFSCDAVQASLTGASGRATAIKAARYSTYQTDRWRSLSSDYGHSNYTECEADEGVHGQTGVANPAAKPYPANEGNGGPWKTGSSGKIDWSQTGDTYTFYSANYLNWRESASTTTTNTRLEVVQKVFEDLIGSLGDNINLAVMRFDDKSQNSNKGGYFVMPMQQLDHDPTTGNADDYITAVNNFTPDGYTPLSETLYESYLFFRGDGVKFGDDTDPGTNVAGVLGGNDAANPDTTKYKSPIEFQCQSNFVILLTDGEPTYDTNADSEINAMIPGSCNGNCLDELAEYMFTNDCRDNIDSKQRVITYTIGFNTDQALLQAAATKGGGKYYTANDTIELADAFTEILTEISAVNDTFIAPAVSVNAFNRFNHRSELYYATFKPSSNPRWNGNVKRYALKTLTEGEAPVIVDKNSIPAVNSGTGFFDDSALSFWTDPAGLPNGLLGDGDEVALGGAASNLSLPRTIYTYTGDYTADDKNLTLDANALSEDNAAITKTMLGNATMSDSERTNMLMWARGVDILDQDADEDDTDVRPLMGDPLHTKPKVITYGGTEETPDITLFVGTNEGHLTAIDTDDGSEIFTFVPQELLPNLSTLFDDNAAVDHPSGLDGPLTAWFNDLNGNGVLYDSGSLESDDAGNYEHVYLYMGMRRGGRNYYSLDVTNRSVPKLKWAIKGGSGDFSELGQTWSAPSGGKIKVNGTDKMVMIFGGGYDVDQDDNATLTDDDIGRAIFIVDATTGEKLWQAGPAGSDNGSNPDLLLSEMTNSIPADVRAIDTNSDGYLDRLYVGDMGGKIWRFDLDIDGNTGVSNLATGGVIAKLGDTVGGVATDNRRFYYAPDVSLSEDEKNINIAIGSGYRAHPLNTTIHDAFFILRDKNVFTPPRNVDGDIEYTAVTITDLHDATANLIGQGTAAEKTAAISELDASDGLFMWIKTKDSTGNFVFAGEKVLAKSLTYSGIVAFSTYTPVPSIAGSCSPSQGTSRLYLVSVEDLTPVQDNDTSGGALNREDRSIDLIRGGIPPEPTLIFHEDDTVMAVGTELPDVPEINRRPRKVYWYTE